MDSVDQPRALRWQVGEATVIDPGFVPLDKFDPVYSNDPHVPRSADNALDGVPASTVESVRTRVDAVAANSVVRVHTHPQYQVLGDDTRERIRSRDHEYDDHLQPRGLLRV